MIVLKTWSVLDLTHTLEDGGVIQAKWKCHAAHVTPSQKVADQEPEFPYVERPEYADEFGVTSFEYNPSSSNFVPFEDLTQDTILGWIKAVEDVEEIEAKLESEVLEKIQNPPKTSEDVPW